MKTVVRYSESFKLQVLRKLEGGRFESLSAAMRAYGIRGQATVKQWALQYGKGHLLGKVVRVERPEEADEKQRLRRRVRELEEALADAHLKQRFDEAYLKMACRAAGIEDVEGFKKSTVGSGERGGGERGKRGGMGHYAAVCACGDEPPELLRGAVVEAAARD